MGRETAAQQGRDEHRAWVVLDHRGERGGGEEPARVTEDHCGHWGAFVSYLLGLLEQKGGIWALGSKYFGD